MLTIAIIVSVICFLWALIMTMKMTSSRVTSIPAAELKKLKRLANRNNDLITQRDDEIKKQTAEINVLKEEVSKKQNTSDIKKKDEEILREQGVANAAKKDADEARAKLAEVSSELIAKNEEEREGKDEKEKLYDEVAEKTAEIEKLIKETNELKEDKEAGDMLVREAGELRERLGNVCSELETKKSENQEQDSEIERMTREIEILTADKKAGEEAINECEQIRSEKESLERDKAASEEGKQQEILKLNEEVSALKTESEEKERAIKELEELKGEMERVYAEMSLKTEKEEAHQREVDQIREEVTFLKEEKAKHEEAVRMGEIVIETMTKTEEELQTRLDQSVFQEEEVLRLKIENERVIGDLTRIKEEKDLLEYERREAHNGILLSMEELRRDINDKNDELKLKQNIIEKLQAEIDRFGEEKKVGEEAVRMAEESRSRLHFFTSELDARTNDLRNKQLEVESLNDEMAKMRGEKEIGDMAMGEARELRARIDQINGELTDRRAESRDRLLEMERLNAELARLKEERETLEVRVSAAEETRARLEQVSKELCMSNEEAKEKHREIEYLNSEVNRLIELNSLGEGKILAAEEAVTRSEQMRFELSVKAEEVQGKQFEIERLNKKIMLLNKEKEQIEATKRRDGDKIKEQTDENNVRLMEKDNEVREKESEIERLAGEIERLNSGYKQQDTNIDRIRIVDHALGQIEKTMDEHKMLSHELRQRLEGSRRKVSLLNEKTRGNVETVTTFASGKEFADLRKSTYIDEMIQKYETEIKTLRMKTLDLERKTGIQQVDGF